MSRIRLRSAEPVGTFTLVAVAIAVLVVSVLEVSPALAQSPIETSVTVDVGPTPLPPSEDTWYRATVSPAPGDGTMSFELDGEPIPGCAAQSLTGVVVEVWCMTTTGSVGDYLLVVSFSGSGDFSPSSASATIAVRPPSFTRLRTSKSTVTQGQGFDLRARVTPTPADGVVRFWTSGSPIDGCSSVPIDADGRAHCRARVFEGGERFVDAWFMGNDELAISGNVVPVAVRPLSVRITPQDRLARPGRAYDLRFKVLLDGQRIDGRSAAEILERCRATVEVFGRAICPRRYERGQFVARFRIPQETPEGTVPAFLLLKSGGRVVDQKHAGIEVRPYP